MPFMYCVSHVRIIETSTRNTLTRYQWDWEVFFTHATTWDKNIFVASDSFDIAKKKHLFALAKFQTQNMVLLATKMTFSYFQIFEGNRWQKRRDEFWARIRSGINHWAKATLFPPRCAPHEKWKIQIFSNPPERIINLSPIFVFKKFQTFWQSN